MIAALYVAKNGSYINVPGVDPWPEDRDARLYRGPHSVVAHPPCQRWGKFWAGQPLLDKLEVPGLKLTRADFHPGRRTVGDARFCVVTIHGQETPVVVDDWIITEPDGTHHYPCKPDIFEARYTLCPQVTE